MKDMRFPPPNAGTVTHRVARGDVLRGTIGDFAPVATVII